MLSSIRPSRRHWPAAGAGALAAGALVLALVGSSGAGSAALTGAGALAPVASPVTAQGSPTGGSPTPTATTQLTEPNQQPDGESVASPAGDAADSGKASAGSTRAKVKIPQHGSGTFARARVDGPVLGAKGRLLRFDVRVEKRLPYEADEVAREIEGTLADPRSWAGSSSWRLELVSKHSRADFTIYLASPDTVDELCWPLRTYGRVSCRTGSKVVLNAWRWAHGATAYGKDLTGYREYLVNHEVGHRLGHGHVGCPGKGKRAPVMMQQTKSVGTCRANPWPAPKRG